MKTLRKFWKWFKGLFSKDFKHPIVVDQIQQEIERKLQATRAIQVEEMKKQAAILDDFLRALFSKPYTDGSEMMLAFNVTNRKWKQHCRTVNATNKHINLKKTAFEDKFKSVLTQMQKNKAA